MGLIFGILIVSVAVLIGLCIIVGSIALAVWGCKQVFYKLQKSYKKISDDLNE